MSRDIMAEHICQIIHREQDARHTRKVLTMTKADLLDALQHLDDDTELLVSSGGKVASLVLGHSASKEGAIAVQVISCSTDESDIFWD